MSNKDYINYNDDNNIEIKPIKKNSENSDTQHISPKKSTNTSMDSFPKRVLAWRFFKPVLTVFIGICLVCFTIYLICSNLYAKYVLPVDAESTEEIEIVIPSGSSLTKISELLEQEGLIRNAKAFKYYVDFSDMSSKIKAGTFILSPSMTFDDIIDVIKRPNELSAEVWVQIREGLTVEQIADVFIESGVDIDKDVFLDLCKNGTSFVSDSKYIKEMLEQGGATNRVYALEGYLFPDKYRFYTDASEETVIKKLLDQYDNVVTDAYQQRASELGYSMDQILIIASMIEKEAKTDDFTKVSGVFHNRLNKGWPLGSDATIKYITGTQSITLSSAELDIDSPYNTYTNKGLPPGPICNPGKAAIEAALYPDEEIMKEGYMYFCLGDPSTGETVFSKTQEEHDAAIAKYAVMWSEYEKNNKAVNNNE